MAQDDWYRNEDWNADIEAAFRTKLSRSRSSRPQYLWIQASHLIARHPLIALSLIDEFFDTGDDYDVASALDVKAKVYHALGKIEQAVATYKEALDWEYKHPGRTTTAALDLSMLVVNQRHSQDYDYCLEILASRFSATDHAFPIIRYKWNGCNALIASDRGHVADAQEFAERALRAAAETESPFRDHRNVGLVQDGSDEFGRRLKRIARPSKLRSLFRVTGNT